MTAAVTPGREEMLALADRIKMVLSGYIPLTGEKCQHHRDRVDCMVDACNPYARDTLLKEAEAALRDAAKPADEGWQDISTAPKDENVLLGWWRDWPERKWECEIELASCTKGGWRHGRATHWQPLPAPHSEPKP